MTGRIKSVVRGQGIGYIRDDLGRDVFFHKGDVVNKAYNDLTVLTVGQSGLESRKPTGPDIKVVFTSDAQAKVDELVVAAIRDMNWIVGDAATAIARGLDVRWRDGEGRGQAE